MADALEALLELRALIAAVSVKLDQEWIEPKHRAHQQHAAIAILPIGRMDNGKQQQTLRVYRDMAFLALDLLACIVTVRINRDPPFSVLLTLWLSMMATVGLASRSACSRHATYSV